MTAIRLACALAAAIGLPAAAYAQTRAKADVTQDEREMQTYNDGEQLVGADFRHWQG